MQRNLLLSLMVLILSSLACSMFIGGPEYPEGQIPVSTEIAGSVEEQLRQAIESAKQSGVLSFTITEAQLTSLLAQRLAADPNSFITSPQVYLRDNEIQVYGKAVQGYLQANIRITLSASVDVNGQPQIAVKAVDFGPLPVPEGINNSISAIVNEAFTGALGPAATGFRLESISIANGLMTFTGRIK
jgi:hypothetical protein